MAEEKKSIVESKLNPLNHLDPFITRVASSAVFDSDLPLFRLILGFMILPTIISISEDSLKALPPSYKAGGLALGATHWQTIWRVLIPAARSGIVASIILGMGRAIGETMAMIMILGNAVKMPTSFLDSARTLTTNIGIEMGYASGDHRQALFATGVVLFFIIMILNSLAIVLSRRRAG